jgi:hypothetical protein
LSVILFADVAQQAEQLFRKQQVAGSSPAIGSTENRMRIGKMKPVRSSDLAGFGI